MAAARMIFALVAAGIAGVALAANGAGECERVRKLSGSKYFVGHEHLLGQMQNAICSHVKLDNPIQPLVLSLHGSPGTGKSLFHQLLADALYDRPHRLPFLSPPSQNLTERISRPFRDSKYSVIRGSTFAAVDKPKQLEMLADEIQRAVVPSWFGWIGSFLWSVHTPVVVIEDYEKLHCSVRDFFRDVVTAGKINDVSVAKSIIILETNQGQASLLEMARSKKINVAKAQKDLKQSIVGTYLNLDKQFNGVDPCTGTVQQRVTALHKLVSKISLFIPFFPLTTSDIESMFKAWMSIINENLANNGFGSLKMEVSALRGLLEQVEFEDGISTDGGATAALKMKMLMATIDDWKDFQNAHSKKCNGNLMFTADKSGFAEFGVFSISTHSCTMKNEL